MPDSHEALDWMIRTQLEPRGIRDPRVLEAMRAVDRARFVPPDLRSMAYDDHPLGIGEGQTISQPYMVAEMTQSLDPAATHRVLEIGTGSGYQTAILARLAYQVYTIEVHATLVEKAKVALDDMGLANIRYRIGNGRRGWPEEAPFDRILCAAAAEEIPQAWIDQLADPGILLLPVGDLGGQSLVKVTRSGGRVTEYRFCPCRFVPLVEDEAGE